MQIFTASCKAAGVSGQSYRGTWNNLWGTQSFQGGSTALKLSQAHLESAAELSPGRPDSLDAEMSLSGRTQTKGKARECQAWLTEVLIMKLREKFRKQRSSKTDEGRRAWFGHRDFEE